MRTRAQRVMTVPLAMLAFFAIALGAIGTPAWPWFRAFLKGRAAALRHWRTSMSRDCCTLMGTSSAGRLSGAWVGLVALRQQVASAEEPDALEKAIPPVWAVLRDKFYVDEFYGAR